jgi:phosphohistidine phosphatase SixA
MQAILRICAVALLLSVTLAVTTPRHALASEDDAWAALGAGAVVLLRHATAPGVGDPPQFKLGDCATQRNLDEAGRAQARRIGAAFGARRIAVGRVLTSRWCRTRETAEIAFPGQAGDEPAFDSIFQARDRAEAQTKAARDILARWRGPGALVVVTHQVNIAALTGVSPGSGEGVVLARRGGELAVVGRVRP